MTMTSLTDQYIRLQTSILHDTQSMTNGCLLWTGSCVWRRYGKKKVTIGSKIHGYLYKNCMTVSRAAYLTYRQLPSALPSKYDVSHLCHQPLCVAAAHLVLEHNTVNKKRQKCKNEQRCYGHPGSPDCLWLPKA